MKRLYKKDEGGLRKIREKGNFVEYEGRDNKCYKRRKEKLVCFRTSRGCNELYVAFCSNVRLLNVYLTPTI